MSDSAITYKDMVLAIGKVYASIYDLQIEERANHHGRLSLVAMIKSDDRKKVLHESQGFALMYMKNKKVKSLFQGIINKIDIQTEGKVSYLKIQAITSSYFLDYGKRSHSFQNVKMTSFQLIDEVMKSSKKSKTIKNIPNTSIKELVLQYEETDWAFLRRFVSRYGAKIFVDCSDLTVKLEIGPSSQAAKVKWDDLSYQIYQNLEGFHSLKDNHGIKGTQWDHMRYVVTSYDIVPLGRKIVFQNKTMYVESVTRNMSEGVLVNQYILCFEEGLLRPKTYNDMITGISIHGEVLAAKRNRVQILLEIDGDKSSPNPFWFPFSTVAASSDGSGWYCMPKKGDPIRVFFPVNNEKAGYAIASSAPYIPTTSQPNDPMGNPNSKNISTPYGKEIKFTETGLVILVDGGNGEIVINNDGKITMTAIEKISFGATEKILFEAKENLSVQANSAINLANDKGASIAITEDKIEINGVEIHQNLPEE